MTQEYEDNAGNIIINHPGSPVWLDIDGIQNRCSSSE